MVCCRGPLQSFSLWVLGSDVSSMVLARDSAWVMFPLLGASAVGRWPFPVDISADQLLHGDSSRRHTLALSFASPAKFARSHAALLHVTHRSVCRFQAPLLGFTQRSPLHRTPRVSSPGCPGPGVCQLQTWSVLVVLPDFDGLLHTRPCGFVAPRYRPWGSPGFQPTGNVTAAQLTFPAGADTLRSFPLPGSGFPVSRARPSRRWLHIHRSVCFAPTSGVCSTGKSVAHMWCCHLMLARCSLGLVYDFRLSPDRSRISPDSACTSPKRRAACPTEVGRSAWRPSSTLFLRKGL